MIVSLVFVGVLFVIAVTATEILGNLFKYLKMARWGKEGPEWVALVMLAYLIFIAALFYLAKASLPM